MRERTGAKANLDTERFTTVEDRLRLNRLRAFIQPPHDSHTVSGPTIDYRCFRYLP